MKYFIYCRKSTEDAESQSLSLPAQLRVLTQLAGDRKLSILDTIEESKSAKTPNNRPLFRKMLNRMYANHAQGLVVWHVNRLARNPMEAGELQQMLVDGKIKEIITPDETITKDNANDIILGVKFGEASQYSKDLSKNVKRGLKEKMIRGQYPNRAPSFYVNVGKSAANKNITPDPRYADIFKKWIKWFKDTCPTLTESANWLNNKGALTCKNKSFNKARISDILNNPVYAGYMQISGEPMIKGTWEPLISLEDHKIIKSIVSSRHVVMKQRHEKGYKQLIVCGHCGCAITCSHKVKNGLDYIYYHCTRRRGKCDQIALTEKNLEDQILKQIVKIRINPIKYNLMIEMTKSMTEFKRKASSRVGHNTLESIDTIKEQKEMILDLFLTKAIDREIYNNKILELDNKIMESKKKYASTEFDYDQWFSFVQGFYTKCRDMQSLYIDGDIDERTTLVRSLGWNLKMMHGNLSWNFEKPWDAMLDIDLVDDRTVLWAVAFTVGTFFRNSANTLLSSISPSSNLLYSQSINNILTINQNG